VSAPLYLDTSAVLRATLESGTTPELEARIAAAPALITSRLSLVEASRALLRARTALRASELRLGQVEQEIESLWARCDIWELTAGVCEAARVVAPGLGLRTLDALHLATFLAARRRIPGLAMLTADDRLRVASGP
jgi:predicted nucleic acid-binding protein